MGGGQSTNNYPRLPPSSSSLSQPLLYDKHTNKCQHEINENTEKSTTVEEKIREFKSAVSRFESRLQYNTPAQPSPPEAMATQVDKEEQSGNQKEIQELKAITKFLHHLMKKQEDAIESLRDKNAALENRMNELANIAYDPNAAPSQMMNGLLGCLVAIVFLLSFLIGINL